MSVHAVITSAITDLATGLRATRGRTGSAVVVPGRTAVGDGGGGMFFWDSTIQVSNDDDMNVFAVADGSGGWVRCANDSGRSVKDWGAKGNESHDDTDALESALGSGEILFWPPGRYKTTRILLTPAGTRIVAQNAVLVPYGSSNNFAFPSGTSGAVIGGYAVSDVQIEGLGVDLSANQILCNGIAFVPNGLTVCTDVTVQGCQVTGFDAHVYHIWSLFGKRIKIFLNRVDGRVTEWPLNEPETPSEGIEAFGGEDVQIIGNSARRMGGSGFSLGAFTADGAEVRGLICSQNYAEDCRNGVRLTTGENTAKTEPVNIYDVLIQANTIRRSFNNGVLLNTWHAGAEFSNVRIDTNIIDDARSSGIKVLGTDHASDALHRVEVTGNDIRNVAAGDINDAGIFAADMPGIVIASTNRIRDGIGHGLRLQRCPRATVSKNFIEKFGGSGIKVEDCDDLVICTNRITGHDTGGGNVAILVGNAQRGVITDNYFERTADSFVADSTEIIVDSNSSGVSTKRNHRLGAGPFITNLVNNQCISPIDDVIQTSDRPLNSIFVVGNVDAEVVYNAQINIGGGGGGEQIELRIGPSSPPTQMIDYANIAAAGISQTVKLVGRVPAGYYVEIVTIPAYGSVSWSNNVAKARERLNPS